MFKTSQSRNYFEEQFEESEPNIPDRIYEQVTYTKNSQYQPADHKPSVYSQSDEVPIQLLKLLPNGKFEINYDAIDLINSYSKPIGIVCLAGKYRTGKSFLLNKLLGIKGSGFKVDSSTTACTEGIWMWSKPMYNPKEDCYLFFIDTQGSESTNRDSDHDAQIFTLGILISSYFIYNSVGAIDEMSISQLNLVTTLSKTIMVSQQNNEGNLHQYMPKFLWLLRDFILETRNQYGDRLSPQQYLESCLLQQNSQIKSNPAVKNIRRAMVNLFRDRDCMMLVRPAVSQDELKNLNSLPDSRLRPEFLEGVVALRNKILSNAGPKLIKGESSSSLMLTELIIAYTNTMNDEGIPNITSAWQHLGEQAALDAYDDALEVYNEKYEQYFSVDQPKGQEIHTILKEMRDEALDAYDCGIDAPNERIRNKLKNLIVEKEKAIIHVNNELNEAKNVEILRDCSQELMRNLEMGKYSAENPKLLTEDLNSMINEYNSRGVGPRKCQVLSMFLTNFNPIIIKSYTQTTRTKIASSLERVGAANQVNDDNQQLIDTLQQRIRSLEQQMNSKGNYNSAEAEQASKLRTERDAMKKQIEAMHKNKDGAKCCLLF